MKKGLLDLGLFSLLTGAAAIFYKIAVDQGVTPLDVAFTVSLVSLVVLTPFLYNKKATQVIKIKAKELAVVGLTSTGLANLLLITGLVSTTATNAGFIFAFIPVLTVLFARYNLKERHPPHFAFILALMTAGGILLAFNGGFSSLSAGDAMVFLAAILLSFNNTYTKKTLKGILPDTVTLGRFLYSTLFLAVLGVAVFRTDMLKSISLDPVSVIAAGLLSGFGVMFLIRAIKAEGASVSSLANLTATLVTAVIGLTLLQEQLIGFQALGAGLIGIGAVAFAWLQKKQTVKVR